MKYDFSGWVTKNNVRCSDGRTIIKDAFADQDQTIVPLLWQHQHDDAKNVLGHVLLENREDGVYGYATCNDTPNGRNAKEMVKNGDITSFSIWANRLKQDPGKNVMHGVIREVSLVLAGANPEAYIDTVLCHEDEVNPEDYEAVIYTGENLVLSHEDDEPEEKDAEKIPTAQEVFDSFKPEQKAFVRALVDNVVDDVVKHADEEDEDEPDETEKTVDELIAELDAELAEDDENQNDVDEADNDDAEDESAEHSEDLENGGDEMKRNVWDTEVTEEEDDVLTHAEELNIIGDAKRYGSMKESALQHGITEVEYLFPDAKTLNTPPDWIKRDTGWVADVMNGTRHTPFSRIKSMFANITEDEARAKGYIKGHLKKEEVFPLLKRTTEPTTVYKKQKMDRDDVVDITSFDVVAWLKSEMRMMLDEEIARAILIGDGRDGGSEDHIPTDHIRPVAYDEPLYTIQVKVKVKKADDAATRAKAFIVSVIRARKQYKGSGNPTLFTTEDVLTECLLLEDGIGHALYADEAALARKLRVKKIVTVPVMEGAKGKGKGNLLGVVVNLTDYNVGADKGGAVNMFDDFDIDYNQQKYLIETRCSGALVKPYSAMAIEEEVTDAGVMASEQSVQ